MKHIPVIAAVMLLAACGKSFDPAKVKHGMSQAELTDAIGEPDQRINSLFTEVWKYGRAGVTFKDGQVDTCFVDFLAESEKQQRLQDSAQKVMDQMTSDFSAYSEALTHMNATGDAANYVGHDTTDLVRAGVRDSSITMADSSVWYYYGPYIARAVDGVVTDVYNKDAVLIIRRYQERLEAQGAK